MKNLNAFECEVISGGTEGVYVPEPGSYFFPLAIADIPVQPTVGYGGGSSSIHVYML